MKRILYTIYGLLVSVLQVSAAVVTADDSVKDIRQINASAVEVLYRDGHRLTIDFRTITAESSAIRQPIRLQKSS